MTKVWYNLTAMLIGALKLTDSEVIVFRWFAGFVISGKMQSFEKSEIRFFWVAHKKVADDLKFLKRKTEWQVRRIFKKLVEKKVLYFSLVDNHKTYYALTDIGYDLCTPLLKAKHKQLSRPADHKQTYPQARRYVKPDTELPATILKRIMPQFKP